MFDSKMNKNNKHNIEKDIKNNNYMNLILK